jgi:hypothetical protein
MTRKAFTKLAIVSVVMLALAAATIGLVTAMRHRASRLLQARADSILSKKEKPEAIKVGRNAEAAIGANESRAPDSSADIQAYKLRAYPADDIPIEATIAAQNGWAALKAASDPGPGTWQLIGPAKQLIRAC